MNPNASSASTVGSTHYKYLIITLGILTAFAPFATDMYLSSFQAIATDLQTQISEVQFSLSTFIFGTAVGQLLYGPIIDKYGRKKPLLWGVFIFTLSSLGAIFTPNISLFNGLRFFQAVGGCAGMIVSRAIIKDLFNEQDAAKALSMMMIVQSIGPILAPILGGYLFGWFGWQSIFIFMALFGGGCWFLSRQQIPETLPPEKRKTDQQNILSVFKTLLMDKTFLIPTIAGSLSIALLFTFISSSPFIFMHIFGVPQDWYGWLFGMNAFGMVLSSQLNHMMLKRFMPWQIMRLAMIVTVITAAILFGIRNTDTLFILMPPLFVCVSLVPVIAANSTAIAMSNSGHNAGAASSLVGFMQFTIASVISALVSVFHNGTTTPMCGLILAISCLALALTSLYNRHR
jgi:DHA1 family bicyclomycin/chloramphenicol resistance-like MFS transporter